MTTFKRARSPEQRAERREMILATADDLLDEYSVSELSLNLLATRTGLAKSNVLRYFDSREHVLLQLMLRLWDDWLAALDRGADSGSIEERERRLARTWAHELAVRPKFAELLAVQASVLERNVSPEAVTEFKRGVHERFGKLVAWVRGHVPELTEEQAQRFSVGASLLAGALWSAGNPSPVLEQVYRDNPDLCAYRIDFEPALGEQLLALIRGVQGSNTGTENGAESH
ncbi:TetR family transcriptional regulator [Naumannella halotolerans]|uniref:AcrR family transcriptional regulator n=1 Tax=Naumannella halotolerans TaxID=993414 RepID=A0A4R7J1T6_9ACTN|nr:TetR family transcriptional regulator [Naumannella halotolerans]TDT31080.1 AcrR family transcriptional regulator [Naumannella halotolerans]